MNAIAKAEEMHRELYRDKPDYPPFIVWVGSYLRHAFVVCTPTTFVMMRPVNLKGQPGQIVDPSVRFKKPDAWFVYSAVGQLRDLPQLMPFPLPFVCFYRAKRREKLKTYTTQNLFRRILCQH